MSRLKCTVNGYIGLLGNDLTEPPKESGYKRVPSGDVNLLENTDFLKGRQFVFPEVTSPGYGQIFCAALYDAEKDGNILYIWPLPQSVDVHEGVIPGLINGQLLRGIDVSSEVIVKLAESISAANL